MITYPVLNQLNAPPVILSENIKLAQTGLPQSITILKNGLKDWTTRLSTLWLLPFGPGQGERG